MSVITKVVSNIILLIIALTWAVLCLNGNELLALPESVVWVGGILFAGDRGVDFLIQKFGGGGKNATTNSA